MHAKPLCPPRWIPDPCNRICIGVRGAGGVGINVSTDSRWLALARPVAAPQQLSLVLAVDLCWGMVSLRLQGQEIWQQPIHPYRHRQD